MNIKLKRAYEPAEKSDGTRVLVDRLWPRGVKKEKVEIDVWAKDVAPSGELRTWYGHDPEKWKEFQKRYKAELKGKKKELAELKKRLGSKATFVYGAKDEEHTHALVLKEVVEKSK